MNNGINLIGYTRAESGLGEAIRSAAKSLHAVGIPFCMINFPWCPSRQEDVSWKHKEVKTPLYKTNIFFINADQMAKLYRKSILKKEWLLNRYNIGYWHWELPEFPNQWLKSFSLVDEVWVPSDFTFGAVSKKTAKPVIKIPHSILMQDTPLKDRSFFHLPGESFLFLTMFDLHSTSVRKNPDAVIEAYKRAFHKNDDTVGLVLKLNNASQFPNEVESLKMQIKDYPNIFLIDKVLSRQEVNELMNITDSLVSLHRAEGFGLPMAEAMYLGKPVIATNWSGNVDFMSENSACLVNFMLKELGEDIGPYKAGQHWAEPDIEHAASLMEKVFEDERYANEIGMNAKTIIRTKYSPSEVGAMYQDRLKKLGLLSKKKNKASLLSKKKYNKG